MLEASGFTNQEFNKLKGRSIVIQEAVEKGETIKLMQSITFQFQKPPTTNL